MQSSFIHWFTDRWALRQRKTAKGEHEREKRRAAIKRECKNPLSFTMVAKRRQSHPKATAKPDAFARATAGHPKAAHKARRCPTGRTTHPHRRIAKKRLQNGIPDPPGNSRKRLPRTGRPPTLHLYNGTSRTFSTPSKHPRKEKELRPEARADPPKKAAGFYAQKSMEKANPFHDDVIFLIFFGQVDYRIYLLNKIFIRSNNDKIIFITAKLYFYIKSVCDFDLFGIYRRCPLCVVHARS